jgi:hypothetical protein
MKFRQLLSSLVLAFALLGGNTALAADNAAVIGKWTIALSFQGQSVDIALTIAQGANGLEGTWAGPQGSTPISDVSFDGENLKFTRTGQQGQVTMTFKVAGDTLSGNLTTPNGDLPITGKKSA